jgi:hypothetical protein
MKKGTNQAFHERLYQNYLPLLRLCQARYKKYGPDSLTPPSGGYFPSLSKADIPTHWLIKSYSLNSWNPGSKIHGTSDVAQTKHFLQLNN